MRLGWMKTVRLALGAAGALSLFSIFPMSCTTARIPLTKIDVPVPNLPLQELSSLTGSIFRRGEGDLRNALWTQAFDAMHEQIALEYPFTEHRGIDWDGLHAAFRPEIARAQKHQDSRGFYLALRKYVYSVPDGNMRISEDKPLRQEAIGGGYGFAVSQLDDGRVVAHLVMPDSPAARGGMRWGAELLEWNGKPIGVVLADTPVWWADIPPATAEGKRLWQCRLLVRAPEGTALKVRFKNEGSEQPQEAALTAEADKFQTLEGLQHDPEELSTLESPIQWRLLPGNCGYVKIFFEGPTWNTPFPALVFKKALSGFIERNIQGIVLDLRGNSGGDAELAAKFLAHLVKEPVLYRDAAFLNPETGVFESSPEHRIEVTPMPPCFENPIAVLIDGDTFNSGEGIARVLKGRANARLFGVQSTHGSFGVVGGDIALPDDITLSYPVGRALEAQGQVLVDSNAQGKGGVEPDTRIPLTRETLHRRFVQGRDAVLDEAVAWLGEQASRVP